MSWPCPFQFTVQGVANDVGDGVVAAGQIAAVVELVVEHTVEPVGLVREAAHRVGLVAPAVAEPAEVAAFAELRPLIGHLPDHPLRDLVSAAQVPRPEAAEDPPASSGSG